jgi:NADH-ubiquinone oxidoreductase chain 1
VRFDTIIVFCWTMLLPVIMAFIVLVPSILIAFDIIPLPY